MTTKRKPTYEQDMALARGRDVARANQRRRVSANQRADAATRAREEREAAQAAKCADGWHSWTNWNYADDYKTETRGCRDCDHTETREVRL